MSNRPKIVVLCGSTRFRAEYEQAFRDEEHAGRICLTVPCYKDDPCCKTPEEQARLDALHRHKIDLADELYVINPGGYIGDSTRAELAYAIEVGKPVRFMVPPDDGVRPGRWACVRCDSTEITGAHQHSKSHGIGNCYWCRAKVPIEWRVN